MRTVQEAGPYKYFAKLQFALEMEKEEGRSLPLRSTFLPKLITQPWQPRPDDHCRYRKPCKLCGA